MSSTELVPVPTQQFTVNELQAIAKNVAASRLFGGAETEQAAFTLMMLCQAEGLHAIQAMRRYHIIKGRPTMRADAMQAEFQRQGGVIRWERSDAEECTARFVHRVHAPEPGVKITLTMRQAASYGLTENALYRKFPDQMLRARVISQGVRMVLPGVVVGIYTPEEVDGPEVFDVTPREAAPARDAAPAKPPEIEGRAGVNAAFAPPDATDAEPARPANDREEVKLPGDRIGARGLDVRHWAKLLEQEVGRVNRRLAATRAGHNLEPAEATTGERAVNHMATWAADEGAEIPTKAGASGKVVRAGVGKVNAYLAELYLDDRWRGPMRSELRAYLDARLAEAEQVAGNEAFGDRVGPDEADPQLEPAGVDGEAWPPGRE